jgi:hypothetical protein
MAIDVRVLALCGDESHAYFKSVNSQRSRSAVNVIAKADMVIYISGTLFPLGPKTYGASTLKILGSNFMDAKQTMKWNTALQEKFQRLFATESGRMKNWDIMLFRTGLSICAERSKAAMKKLERTERSTHSGSYLGSMLGLNRSS